MSERPANRELSQAYRRIGSVARVASELDVAYETARRWLLEAGVSLRSQGRPSRGAGTASVDTIVERYRAGESFAAIATDLDVSPNTVRNRLIAAGEPLRPRPGWKY
jgi:transposase-like protein